MMRLAQKIGWWSGALSLVAILQAGYVPAVRGQQMPAMPNAVRTQLSTPTNAPAPATPAPSSSAKQAPAPQKPSSATAKPAPAATKNSSNPPAKPAPANAGMAPAAGTPVAPAKPAQHEPARRDPFQSLVKTETNAPLSADKLPPGKAGLVIATLRVDGIVRSPNGMLVVVSNPQERVYFLRQGDQLYDGQVERVDMDGVLFHQTGQDAFGKPIEREVTKRLYPTPGEQQ